MSSAELVEYFTAERQGGFLLVELGLAVFGFGAFLWVARSALVNNMKPEDKGSPGSQAISVPEELFSSKYSSNRN